MDEVLARTTELLTARFHCSQVMLMLMQEATGEVDPNVIRAMGGLGGGMFCQKTCGTLTGGCCLIASFGARGGPDEEVILPYKEMIRELVGWFEAEFGSTQCADLVEHDRAAILATCPGILAKTYLECARLLRAEGVELA